MRFPFACVSLLFGLTAQLAAAPPTLTGVDVATFPVEHLDFPIAAGPFEPTWESIAAQHPGQVDWFREAKLGIWIHWGPQAAGRSGDWYAKHMYLEDHPAAANHRRNFGHPSQFGYKDVLHHWKIPKFNADRLMEKFHDAGFRYAVIMGVHHDNFDLWNSAHQPWNAVKVGPQRDLLREWSTAARKHNIRHGVSFHHEYTWWWWQTAFGADTKGPLAGVPYDGALTKQDGRGKWWEGLDPRELYGIPLTGYPQYDPVHLIAHGRAGIFDKHLAYAKEYATQWALRIMDVIDNYDPDFIYTDGNSPQPFSGSRSGSGYKCDAAQRVVAHYYNRTLERRKEIDTFSIIKFSKAQNGLASTTESRIGDKVDRERMWMGELAVGSWFYAPGFYYDGGSAVRALLEFASRDGNFALAIPLTPEGDLEPAAVKMLSELGAWMNIHGPGIYGSSAWKTWGEGERKLPGGALNREIAEYEFTTEDFRFTRGKDGKLYVWCLTVPPSGAKLLVRSLGTAAGLLEAPPSRVELLGSAEKVAWSQTAEGLDITCPETTALRHAICFRVE